MNDVTSVPRPNALLRKPLGQVQRESETHEFRRSLGPVQLVLLGVGCIIGSGIFVLTGNAAANFAGPAVVISFILAGLACAFAGLSYVGFETVSTAGLESRDPRRHLPIGILGALIICTAIYLAVAAVLTGLVPFRQLGVPDPLAVAVNEMGLPGFALMVKFGAALGLMSVMLTTLYGQTRVFYAMSRDGLLPPVFSAINARWRTPRLGTAIVGVVVALVAALLPISILSDIVSLGVAFSFIIVCVSVIWLRSSHPQMHRPFRVPFGGLQIGSLWLGVIPVLGILFCILMVLPLVADIAGKALRGNPIPALLLGGYCTIGAALYVGYGRRHSKLRGARS